MFGKRQLPKSEPGLSKRHLHKAIYVIPIPIIGVCSSNAIPFGVRVSVWIARDQRLRKQLVCMRFGSSLLLTPHNFTPLAS